MDGSSVVSRLLRDWGQGSTQARDELLPLVYRDLRRRAAAYLRQERPDHTLQPTALVHEAYLRLVEHNRIAWKNRGQFFAVAAQLMRHILVDHARRRLAAKRPDGVSKVVLDEFIGTTELRNCDLLDLDQALNELTLMDARAGQIVELRYFGGLSEQEVADALSISRSSVSREWHIARRWLYGRMTTQPKTR
jgi:RNA polymerase sigma factor (TIGR02999 family)